MKILLAGDSTVANCPTYEYPMSGWGAHLAPHVYTWGAVHNYAKGGATTESFREEGLWHQLRHQAGKGDVVLIQFGHNDQKRPHLAARTGYVENLRRMVADVQAKGAKAILCTSVERRHFSHGVLEQTLGEYPAVVRELAAELGLDVIDLNTWTRALYTELGEEGSKGCFFTLGRGSTPTGPAGSWTTHISTRRAPVASPGLSLNSWRPWATSRSPSSRQPSPRRTALDGWAALEGTKAEGLALV